MIVQIKGQTKDEHSVAKQAKNKRRVTQTSEKRKATNTGRQGANCGAEPLAADCV